MTEERATAGEYGDILDALYPVWSWCQLLIPLRGKKPIGDEWNAHAVARFEGSEGEQSLTPLAEHLAAGGNIGWVVPPGLIVLDCDSESTCDWVHTQLFEKDLAWFDYPAQESREDRHHYILRVDSEIEIGQGSAHLPCGRIDLRVAGKGQIVVAPSIHPDTGTEYRWLVPLPDTLEDIPMIPGDLLKTLLDAQAGAGETNSPSPSPHAGEWDERLGADEGRNDELARLAGGILGKHENFEEFRGHLHGINLSHFQTPLPTAEVATVARSIWRYKGTRESTTDPFTPTSDEVGINMAEVEETAIEWLWKFHLAAGKATAIEGDGGVGKSSLVCDLAARVTTGEPFPGDTERRAPRGVVIAQLEDDLGDTLAPRLIAAGADRSRVIALPFEHYGSFADIDALEAAVKRVDAALIVIDPAQQYMAGIDTNRDNDVRSAVGATLALANRVRASIILIRHITKGAGAGYAAHAGGGSVAFTNLVRIQILVTVNPEGGSWFTISKANICPREELDWTREYELENTGEGLGNRVRVNWRPDRIAQDANECLQISLDARRNEKEEKSSKANDAKDALRELLSFDSNMLATEVFRSMEGMGHSRSSVHRASASIGVVKEKGFDARSRWNLP